MNQALVKQISIYALKLAVAGTAGVCVGKVVYYNLPGGKKVSRKKGGRRKKFHDIPDEEVFPEEGTLEL